MPIDLPDGSTLHCPTCGEEIRVAWYITDEPFSVCFCSCKDIVNGFTDEELDMMITKQLGERP